MADDEYLRREVGRLSDVIDKLATVVADLDEKFLPRREYEEARKADAEAGKRIEERLDSLTNLRDWAVKIVLGAVIVALLGLVIMNHGGTLQ